jgi:hypothetical protein
MVSIRNKRRIISSFIFISSIHGRSDGTGAGYEGRQSAQKELENINVIVLETGGSMSIIKQKQYRKDGHA